MFSETMPIDFQDRITTQKGNIGERSVDDFLKSKGIIPYTPVFDGAHPFDRLCAKNDGSRLYIVEIKTKARRKAYPDTGIDERCFNKYNLIYEKHNICVYLCFVDDVMMKCYGNWLHILKQPKKIIHNNKEFFYPMVHNRIIYFPIDSMDEIFQLSDETVILLKEKTTRKQNYSIDELF